MDTPAYKIAVSRCIMAGRAKPADILMSSETSSYDIKNAPRDAHSREKETCRRRRILQAGHFFVKAKIYDFLVFYVISVS